MLGDNWSKYHELAVIVGSSSVDSTLHNVFGDELSEDDQTAVKHILEKLKAFLELLEAKHTQSFDNLSSSLGSMKSDDWSNPDSLESLSRKIGQTLKRLASVERDLSARDDSTYRAKVRAVKADIQHQSNHSGTTSFDSQTLNMFKDKNKSTEGKAKQLKVGMTTRVQSFTKVLANFKAAVDRRAQVLRNPVEPVVSADVRPGDSPKVTRLKQIQAIFKAKGDQLQKADDAKKGYRKRRQAKLAYCKSMVTKLAAAITNPSEDKTVSAILKELHGESIHADTYKYLISGGSFFGSSEMLGILVSFGLVKPNEVKTAFGWRNGLKLFGYDSATSASKSRASITRFLNNDSDEAVAEPTAYAKAPYLNGAFKAVLK